MASTDVVVLFTDGRKMHAALRRALGHLRDRVSRTATGAVHHAEQAAKDYAMELDLFYTGDYIESFQVVENPGPNGGGALFNDSPHARTIELGRTPGRTAPPLERIRQWVEDKLGVPPGASYPVAMAIAQRIALKGLPPRRVMMHAKQAADDYIADRLRDDASALAMAKDLWRMT